MGRQLPELRVSDELSCLPAQSARGQRLPTENVPGEEECQAAELLSCLRFVFRLIFVYF